MNFWNARKLTSIPDEQLTQAHVDAARREAEAAHDEVLRLIDPKHPRYENYLREAPPRQREIAAAKELAELRRTEWKTLEERLETKLRRERAAREEELYRRNVHAAEVAAKEASRQSALAQRQAPSAIAKGTEEVMTDAARLVEERDALRLAMLRRMYEASGGHTNYAMDPRWLFNEVGTDEVEGWAAARWLIEEGLARFMGQRLSIEHAGIREVEQSIRNPESETDHFSPPVISMVNNFNIHGSTIGAVQTGNTATANVQQNIGTMPDKLVELFAQLREQASALPDATQRDEVAELVDDLEEEAKKEKRNEMRLKMLSTGLSTISTLTPIVRMILGVLGVHIAG